MSFFTDKHVVVAMLAAPVLAVLTWLATDAWVAPKGEPAQAGDSYPLVAKPNCRVRSGYCSLVNGDFRVELVKEASSPALKSKVAIASDTGLEGVRYELVDANGVALEQGSTSATAFTLSQENLARANQIRLAFSHSRTLYFVETSTAFLLHEKRTL